MAQVVGAGVQHLRHSLLDVLTYLSSAGINDLGDALLHFFLQVGDLVVEHVRDVFGNLGIDFLDPRVKNIGDAGFNVELQL